MASSHVLVGSGSHRVLALHGWFGSARGWGSLPDYLDGSRYTYAFMDLRGYGGSKQVSGDFTMEEAAADAVALADELGWDRFSLVGHSMGGVAIQHAALQAPGRVRRLVGINPVPATGVPLDADGWALFSGAATSSDNRAAIISFSTGAPPSSVFVASVTQHSPLRRSAATSGRGRKPILPSGCGAARLRSRSSWERTTPHCPND
jgi:pimeloyl-ACP methyl ester carboxylesterase